MNYKKTAFSVPYVWLLVDPETTSPFPVASVMRDNGLEAISVTKESLLAERQAMLQNYVDCLKSAIMRDLKPNLNENKKEQIRGLLSVCLYQERLIFKKIPAQEFLSKYFQIKTEADVLLFNKAYLPLTEQGRIQVNSWAGKDLYPITAFGVCSNAIRAHLIGGIDPGDPEKVAQWVVAQTRK